MLGPLDIDLLARLPLVRAAVGRFQVLLTLLRVLNGELDRASS